MKIQRDIFKLKRKWKPYIVIPYYLTFISIIPEYCERLVQISKEKNQVLILLYAILVFNLILERQFVDNINVEVIKELLGAH